MQQGLEVCSSSGACRPGEGERVEGFKSRCGCFVQDKQPIPPGQELGTVSSCTLPLFWFVGINTTATKIFTESNSSFLQDFILLHNNILLFL